MATVYLGDGRQVDRGVLADGGVRAAAGLDAQDAVLWQGLQPVEDQGVLLGVDVVGHDGDAPAVAHLLAELLDQGGLARADRAADADPQRSILAVMR